MLQNKISSEWAKILFLRFLDIYSVQQIYYIVIMGFYYKLIIFLLINLGALWLGSLLQGEGTRSVWYQDLSIAPRL
jgi:hypothetical protein